jgi:hypothetical protein
VPAVPALGRLSQPGALTALHVLALPFAAPQQPLAPLSLPYTVARSSFCCVSSALHARVHPPPTASLSAILSEPPRASCSSSPARWHTIALRSPSTAYLGTPFFFALAFAPAMPPPFPPPLGAIASSGVATSTRQCAPPRCPGLARPPPPPLPPLAAAGRRCRPWPTCHCAPLTARPKYPKTPTWPR